MIGIDWPFEAAKLVGQLAGAGLIGWIGVQWAFARYKAEKTWERKFNAYANAVEAFTEMQRILGVWEDLELKIRVLRADEKEELLQSYRAAERSIDGARGIALLILPQEVSALLKSTQQELNRAGAEQSWMDSIGRRYDVIEQARMKLVEIARENLSLRKIDFQ
ncbi:hypothetical protein AB9F35_17295 [Rhizobium leguminosarum]|uniref:hypothetical protein n=1 Tax=Rhizobium leguminosarum TaxID=384 RepID=UPI003F9B183B